MALSHILPLRDFFLFSTLPKSTELVSRFRHLVRKLWNTHAFKAQYSPHELVQEVSKSSKKRFDMTKRSDPVQFLTWFLNGVDAGLRSGDNGIVKELFEGAVVVESQQILGMSADFDEAREITSKSMPFLVLSLDLPPIPLFQDSNESNIIPQVGLSTLFTKYGGVKTQEDVEGVLKRYKITKMPKYLVVYFKRFVKVKKGVEYNPTIVNFNETQRFGDDVYRLVANVCAVEGGEGYVVYLRRQGDGEGWVEVRDLYVHDANWEIICLKNSYIQFWERV
jgi:U4/U6.U5 tri-snRNP-associated protein 2